ncbi:hypothetical protein EJ06DRAFT_579119 [Trichodelitschia bisporula]|uniref:EthD domain-containing protein n=1 Tax=Trichodelitschia bisporula TaxID=703511 RepID=A0A6G1I8Z4_9PEZI|nr:hypothetical protein EJ06DRAFT_579119 [Trichodelitschia bisporula]
MSSFPSYTVPTASGPGVLFVNSKIVSPTLSPSVYTEWYEDVHIRDILATSGIKSAYRYYSTCPEQVERPYMALYPLKAVEFLQSDEFKAIPVVNNVIPGSGMVFDYADFDTRYYTHVAASEAQGAVKGPAPFLAVIALSDPATDAILSLAKDSVRRVRIAENYFSRQNRLPAEANKLAAPPKYLVIVEADTEDGLRGAVEAGELKGGKTASFKLLKGFGEKEQVYFE